MSPLTVRVSLGPGVLGERSSIVLEDRENAQACGEDVAQFASSSIFEPPPLDASLMYRPTNMIPLETIFWARDGVMV
ncbi:hypothetical protein ACIQ7S_00525 [Streptomyces griseoluteus]|uniref:hypothetical protein n=1 Tax=Streptomyces griseoluteus TaxID=29306 RepID=UPI003319E64F